MLKRIDIENYRSLQHIVLDIGNLTVIVGETGRGKSAFVRALQGMVSNQSGHSFVTHGEVDARVSMCVEEHRVSWRKGKSNAYDIDNSWPPDCRVGPSCPQEVVDVLKMERLDVGGGVKFYPNFHSQFDTPFLMKDVGGKVAKIFGFITNANILFLATKEARSRRRSVRDRLSLRQEDLATTKQLVAGFDDLSGQEQKLAKIEKAVCLVKLKEIEVEHIRSLSSDIKCLRDALSTQSGEHSACEVVLECYSSLSDVDISEYDYIGNYLDLIKFAKRSYDLSEADVVVKKKRLSVFSDIGPVASVVEERKNVLTCLMHIKDIQQKLHILEKQYARCVTMDEVSIGNFREFKEQNKVCPLCNKLFDS